jgi:hypothetical protein
MEKLTAVEWIEGYLKRFNFIEESLVLRKAFEQAKNMERKQILEARQNGLDNGFSDGSWDSNLYYNETFNK